MRLHFLAILVAVVAAQAMGFLWYGVLFFEPWAEGFGIDVATLDQADPVPFLLSIVSTLLAALGLSWLIQRLGVQTGLWQ